MARLRIFGTAALVLATAASLIACSRGEEPAAVTTPAASVVPWTVVTAVQLHDMMAKQDVYLVNVHVPFDEGEIPGTDASIPYTDIASRLDELPFTKQTVVIYCRTGNMSGEAARAMVNAGAPPFYELQGGFYAWQDAGYPLQLQRS